MQARPGDTVTADVGRPRALLVEIPDARPASESLGRLLGEGGQFEDGVDEVRAVGRTGLPRFHSSCPYCAFSAPMFVVSTGMGCSARGE